MKNFVRDKHSSLLYGGGDGKNVFKHWKQSAGHRHNTNVVSLTDKDETKSKEEEERNEEVEISHNFFLSG